MIRNGTDDTQGTTVVDITINVDACAERLVQLKVCRALDIACARNTLSRIGRGGLDARRSCGAAVGIVGLQVYACGRTRIESVSRQARVRTRAIDACSLRQISVVDRSADVVQLATVVDIVHWINACGCSKGQNG